MSIGLKQFDHSDRTVEVGAFTKCLIDNFKIRKADCSETITENPKKIQDMRMKIVWGNFNYCNYIIQEENQVKAM